MKKEILRGLGVPRMATMKMEILRGLAVPGRREARVPGWTRLTLAAKEAVIEELAALPEDVGANPVREQAPACARVNEVIDALGRAASRGVATRQDRLTIEGWKTLQHAGAIAVLLDLATLASQVGAHLSVTADTADRAGDAAGAPCRECSEPIAVGEDFQRLTLVGDGDGPTATPIVVHRECMVLRVLGHQYGICGCTDYAGIRNMREAARELMRRRDAAEADLRRRTGAS